MSQFKGLLFLPFILAITCAKSQSISSVYSDRGIGTLNYQGLPNNLAMGEVGIAVPERWKLNHQNPAFLPLNSLTIFQVGLEMDRRSLTNSSQSTKEISSGLRYLNFAFPIISEKWTTSIGLTPYSTVNYNSFTLDSLNNNQTLVSTTFSGSGGLSAFKWSNGVRVSKDLFLGVRTTYLFGTIENQSKSLVEDGLLNNIIDFNDVYSYSGAVLELSAAYKKDLTEESVLNFGAVYELSRDIDGTNDKTFETFNAGGIQVGSRPILEGEPISFTMPSSLGLGASYQVFNKYLIGLDVKSTNWKNAGAENDSFRNTTNIGIGGQWTPDYSNVSRYWKRVTYLMGFNFGSLPYKINGQTIREFGINFGSSLPVGASSLDLAFKYGGLGSTENDLIRETYFRIVIGATINDRWFIKRRYN
ncbi:MAG: hypothetical protein GY816_03860 [Cytophagales bacterium]|nr:hypothetical protein [Cytophagales bacterium]